MKNFTMFAAGLFGFVLGASAEVLEEWNFTRGSMKSGNGVNATFFSSVADQDGDDQYLVTRGNGYSGNISLTQNTDASSVANTKEITVSVTVASFDFSAGADYAFGVTLRDGNESIGVLKFDAIPADDKGPARTRLIGTAIAGIVLDNVVSESPVTFGLTLNFEQNTYTYWVGTPSADKKAWQNRYKAYTGDLDLSGASIDALRWSIEKAVEGNSMKLDQIQVSRTPKGSIG